MLLSILGVGALALALHVRASGSDDPFTADPMPVLFGNRDLASVAKPLEKQRAPAARAARRFFVRHPEPDDDAFLTYALRVMPALPGRTETRRELDQLSRLGRRRNQSGDAAAYWLEAHGDKDVWEEYEHNFRDMASTEAGDLMNTTHNAARHLAEQATDDAKARFERVTPYQVRPSLNALNQAKFASEVKYSYPSKHEVVAFAEMAVLDRYEPQRAPEYRWMAEEIAFSRLYAGGHYLSDLTAGAFLGWMIGTYELHYASLA
jgi:hypothetical protein